ncbi:MAG: Phytochrome-like protein cph2, partial [Frankiales bacterium]|nr:Phytochrome-like protein cph2 [Frankiales bacterium]
MDCVEQLRQASVARYGFAGTAGATGDDGALHGFAVLAQRLMQADFAALHIMDADVQRCVAGSPGVPLSVTTRSASLCEQILSASPRPDVFLTADASQDCTLVHNPWVSGKLGAVRYYAAAPLIGQEGLPLGTLCVWSERSPAVEPPSGQLLRQVADAVMATLDARRRAAELAHASEQVRIDALTPASDSLSYPSPPEVAPTAAASPQGWNIDTVIDDRAVRTLFQPIVHLSTGSIVGFEALSRGPAGSALESPMALLDAAREVDRLGELDWLCRVHAMQAAAASRLHPSMSWFINVEPAGLDIACPEHLLPAL